jgi:hypothetical protein
MTLGAVKTGRLDVPIKVLLYGVEGIGKSTFGALAPNPIFLCAESGTAQLDVARFPEARSWVDVLDAVATLTNEAHNYETLVIDTVDWAEPLCWEHVCDGAKVKSIEDLGYGKGYVKALDEWRLLLRSLERLMSAKRTNVVLLAHSQIKTFKNPEGEDYDRYSLRMHDKAGGLIKDWCDDVLFANHATFALGKKDGKDTRKAVSDGARVVHTGRMAAWDAKNRNGLPEQMPLSWDEYFAAVKAHAPKSAADLAALVEAAIGSLPESMPQEKIEAARASLTKNREDAIKLSALLNWCLSKTGISNQDA